MTKSQKSVFTKQDKQYNSKHKPNLDLLMILSFGTSVYVNDRHVYKSTSNIIPFLCNVYAETMHNDKSCSVIQLLKWAVYASFVLYIWTNQRLCQCKG